MEKIIIMLMMHTLSLEGGIEIPSEISLPPVQQTGLASWYGSGKNNDNGLHGRITATGEVFDPSKKTCASRRIRLGTVVTVRVRSTGNITFCVVNDRGPYGSTLDSGEWALKLSKSDPGTWRGIMDLSRGTAKSLDFSFTKGLEEIDVKFYRSTSQKQYYRSGVLGYKFRSQL